MIGDYEPLCVLYIHRQSCTELNVINYLEENKIL